MRFHKPNHIPGNPGLQLNAKVRAGFVVLGESLHGWCKQNCMNHGNVRKALTGQWTGPRASRVLSEISEYLAARGIDV